MISLIFISCRLFNEGFYLHSRITIQIFNTEAPVLLFNLLGWGECLTDRHFPREILLALLTFLTFLFCVSFYQSLFDKTTFPVFSHAGGVRHYLGRHHGD